MSVPWSLAGEQIPARHEKREGTGRLSQSVSDLESDFDKDTASVKGRIWDQKLQSEGRL